MRLYRDRPGGTVPRVRHDASEPERRLRRALRETYPHLKWRHQSPVGPFYADILCLSERLVIEVDGDTHAEREADDATRTRLIEREGFRVTRVTNADVMQNLEGVVQEIYFSLREKEGARAAKPHGKDEGDHAREKGGTA